MKKLFSLSTGLLALVLAHGSVAAAESSVSPRLRQAALAQPLTDRLIVKYRSGDAPFPTARAELALRVAGNRQGITSAHLRRMANGAHVFKLSRRMSAEEADIVAQGMRAGDSNVEYAEPDRLLQPSYTPADPLFNQQWALFDATAGIRAPTAWDRSRGAGVVVAVIDTGVRPHADLRPNLVAGFDFISDPFMANDGGARDGDPSDMGDAVAAGACGNGNPAMKSSWHGTHVAGIVAAAGNATGVTGVAFEAKVQPLRVLGRCGGYTSDIADAVTWAAGNPVAGIANNPTPARVINLSLGGPGSCGATMQNAINAARAKGAVVIVAAGNENTNVATATPANCAGVVTVAATGPTGGKASYSNFGANVSLAAPGGDGGSGILSTLNTGTGTPGVDNYVAYQGTSMAAPVVSGVAALMLAARPSLTPDQVASLLRSTVTPFPAACTQCGSGIVNASAAVAAAAALASPTPTPAPAPAPAVTTINEVEPNNTLAAAQAISASTVTVNGQLSSGDNDHFRINVAAGKKLVATVTPAARTGAGLTAFLASGQQLITVAGTAGAARQITLTNSGATAVTVVVRVNLSSGAAGSYTLALAQ